ncbi:unnamed protein product [Citrullus colocynthis]|uniref:Uncharacterized protein n=1 Tax=Citrullus colocynthis TaxID=252529 RepID=A0ABP0XQN4_9ROSI
MRTAGITVSRVHEEPLLLLSFSTILLPFFWFKWFLEQQEICNAISQLYCQLLLQIPQVRN